jgi:hypothetical protein
MKTGFIILIILAFIFAIFYKKYEGFEGQIDMMATSNFKPECCPNVYTTSHGCLCNDHNEHLEIISRGGNRIMYAFSR